MQALQLNLNDNLRERGERERQREKEREREREREMGGTDSSGFYNHALFSPIHEQPFRVRECLEGWAPAFIFDTVGLAFMLPMH